MKTLSFVLFAACSSSSATKPPDETSSTHTARPRDCPPVLENTAPGYPSAQRVGERSGATTLGNGHDSAWSTFAVDAKQGDVLALYERCLRASTLVGGAREFAVEKTADRHGCHYVSVDLGSPNPTFVTAGCRDCF